MKKPTPRRRLNGKGQASKSRQSNSWNNCSNTRFASLLARVLAEYPGGLFAIPTAAFLVPHCRHGDIRAGNNTIN